MGPCCPRMQAATTLAIAELWPYDKVAGDLRCGLVSADKARREYGIVFRDGGFEFDAGASGALRARMKSERSPLPVIDRGHDPGRAAS